MANYEEGIVTYLAPRVMRYPVDKAKETFFDILEIKKEEWDCLLKEKCAAYGFEYSPPKFHIILNDCW
jgi:hypothetical protein